MKETWEADFAAHIANKEWDGALAVMASLATDHAGTPPETIKSRALKLIQTGKGATAAATYEAAVYFAEQAGSTGKELAALLLVTFYAAYPAEVETKLTNLALDADWEVREWAASGLGRLLEQNPAGAVAFLQKLARHESGFARRAVAVAVKYAGKNRKTGPACSTLLDIIEPLMQDADPYVVKNLGAFAIGDGLLRNCSAETLARLQTWADSPDENVRLNVGRVFHAAEAAKHPDVALAILEKLADNATLPLQKVVATALITLHKRVPQPVTALLDNWRAAGKYGALSEQVAAKL